jgi:hypothetical protein
MFIYKFLITDLITKISIHTSLSQQVENTETVKTNAYDQLNFMLTTEKLRYVHYNLRMSLNLSLAQ